jgi:hypothetical protein
MYGITNMDTGGRDSVELENRQVFGISQPPNRPRHRRETGVVGT